MAAAQEDRARRVWKLLERVPSEFEGPGRGGPRVGGRFIKGGGMIIKYIIVEPVRLSRAAAPTRDPGETPLESLYSNMEQHVLRTDFGMSSPTRSHNHSDN